MEWLGHVNYWVFVVLLMAGLYTVMARGNLIKKIIGLNIFQASVFLLYITMGKIYGGTAPIAVADVNGGAAGDATGGVVYSNPLPHVLILTAIVVSVSTLAVGLALAILIKREYGTVEEDEIQAKDSAAGPGPA